jgi:pimeloyl-ACP methyl ester carboxylesterase
MVMVLLAGGCGTGGPVNPSFPLDRFTAQRELERMQAEPVPLERPLVIITGYMDIGLVPMRLVPRFQRLSGDDRVIGVTFWGARSFDACRQRVIDAVDRAFPSDDPVWTVEVDVIAMSMGGLVARYAAAELPEAPDGRRLKIARLFTISAPHRGAAMAVLPSWNALHIGMRSGSSFLQRLDDISGNPDYELVPYVRLGDITVGPGNAAPHGTTAWWVATPPLEPAHGFAFADPRILADIARRLRNERPYTIGPPAPLP